MSIVHVDEGNFENEVIKADCTVLVDLYADWCAPCRMLAPILEEIADEHSEYKICKINVDKSPAIAAAFRASSIPMLVVVKEGKITNQSVGYMDKTSILKMF